MHKKRIFLFLIAFTSSLIVYAESDIDAAITLYNSQAYQNAFAEFEKLAANNDPVAQYYLANMYAGGQGIEPDMEKAFDWFRKSADQGHAKAQFKTGLAYSEGYGIKKDPVEAILWFEKAARQDIPEAQFYLAVALQQGTEIKKDLVKAARWMKLAARHGLPEAQTNLGYMYSEGQGLRKDNALAFAWFSIAALSGNEQAEINQQQLSTRMTTEELEEGERLAKKFTTKSQAHDCSVSPYKGIINQKSTLCIMTIFKINTCPRSSAG